MHVYTITVVKLVELFIIKFFSIIALKDLDYWF